MRRARSPLIGILVITSLSIEVAASQGGLAVNQRVTVDGIGPVRIGMTLKEAALAAGTALVQVSEPEAGEKCYYVRAKSGPAGIDFMVTKGRISRVDISNPEVLTASGARIGDSEERLKSLYQHRLKVEPPYYLTDNGHYLIIHSNQQHQMLFETEEGAVTSYRAGKLPEVRYGEGCL